MRVTECGDDAPRAVGQELPVDSDIEWIEPFGFPQTLSVRKLFPLYEDLVNSVLLLNIHANVLYSAFHSDFVKKLIKPSLCTCASSAALTPIR